MLRSPHVRAFTIIELLTVMVIILILAALVLALVGYGQNKAARSKAEGEIAAISTALESYKTDTGTYPRILLGNSTAPAPTGTPACDNLDARVDTDPSPSSGQGARYQSAGAILYRALTGDFEGKGPNSTTAFQKTYYNVPKSELPITTLPPDGEYILDPFGNPYGYSTAYQADLEAAQAAGSTTAPTHGYNPTFDLWCTGGYGASTKAYPNDLTDKTAVWVKNW